MIYRIVILMGALFASIPAVAVEESSDLFVQASEQVNAGNGKPLFAEKLYIEKTLPGSGDISVFGAFYYSGEFHSAYAGVGKKFGDLQVAIGVGSARFDGTNHFAVNPWVYYSKAGLVEGYLSAEHYSREEAEPWFFTGYVHKDITEKVFVGVYGESGFGVGPMIGTSLFDKKLKIWFSVPVASRSNGTKAIVNATWEF